MPVIGTFFQPPLFKWIAKPGLHIHDLTFSTNNPSCGTPGCGPIRAVEATRPTLPGLLWQELYSKFRQHCKLKGQGQMTTTKAAGRFTAGTCTFFLAMVFGFYLLRPVSIQLLCRGAFEASAITSTWVKLFFFLAEFLKMSDIKTLDCLTIIEYLK